MAWQPGTAPTAEAIRITLSEAFEAVSLNIASEVIRRLVRRHWQRLLIISLRGNEHVAIGRRHAGPRDELIACGFFAAPCRLDPLNNCLLPMLPVGLRTAYREVRLDARTCEILAESVRWLVGHLAREALLSRVQNKRFDRFEAEHKNASLGLAPLVPRSNLDPMEEPKWTLLMAIAWICYREPKHVRECWPAWRAGTWEWYDNRPMPIPPYMSFNGPVEGFPGSFKRRAAHRHEYGLPRPIVDPDAAKAQVFIALFNGKLQCEGFSSRTGHADGIPSRDFRHLDLKCAQSGDDVLTSNFVVYEQPTLDRDEILRLWPSQLAASTKGSSNNPPVGTAKAQADCRRWLADIMRRSPNSRIRSKPNLYREACDLFPGIGSPTNVRPSRTFNGAWAGAIKDSGAEAWRDAGRPKGKLAQR